MSTATAKAATAEISTDAHPTLKEVDRPANLTSENAPAWGSDVIAETLRDLKIPYIALNPGASYRGLHDSIVNYLGNETPQMILCLHEEVAVSIAHVYIPRVHLLSVIRWTMRGRRSTRSRRCT